MTTLRELESSLRGDAEVPARNWSLDAANGVSRMVLAMECQAAVGAAIWDERKAGRTRPRTPDVCGRHLSWTGDCQ